MGNNVNNLKRDDPGFPEDLLNIPKPPAQLFYRGLAPSEWKKLPKVAIVGSRKATAYGRDITERLAQELASQGIVVVSGLAYGVDYIAHKAALDAGGLTVAVLPTNLDKIYPAAHENIARQIEKQGTLLTEYPSGSVPNLGNFIARNRIVSGLSDVLLVTEAAAKSGSLHTASFALEQGKTVMAVPGNVNSPASEGTNNLIKSGAGLVSSVDDVLFALGLNPKSASNRRVFRGTKEEELILKLITSGAADQEELSIKTKLDGPSVTAALTMLELSGHIKPSGGGKWLAV